MKASRLLAFLLVRSARRTSKTAPEGAVPFECVGSGGLLPIQAIPLLAPNTQVISAS